MFITDMLKKVVNAAYNLAVRVKGWFIEPKPVYNLKKSPEMEFERVRPINERFRNPQERPAWVKFIFDDYVKGHGRVRSIDALNQVIQDTLAEQVYKSHRR